MKYDLSEFEKRVELGLIRKVEQGPLVLYNYTDKCTYDKAWDEYTIAARGIIFEKQSGRLVAKPFPKFFNLGEMPETQLLNLPNLPYTVSEKVDGSLGILYYYDSKWNMATRGSFNSEQAIKGLEILHSKYNVSALYNWLTYLVEIVYPDNKIVVNYGKDEKLVLLAITQQENEEFRYGEKKGHSETTGIPLATSYDYTIEQMIELKTKLSKDEEGFVVRYDNGLRVKIKGDEYLKIHKIISTMSPISFWESMKDGVVDKNYLMQLPEEFRKDFEPIVEELERQYNQVRTEVEWDFEFRLPTRDASKDGCRQIGIFLAGPNEIRHPSAIFPRLLNKTEALNKYVMNKIRPTGNVLAMLS